MIDGKDLRRTLDKYRQGIDLTTQRQDVLPKDDDLSNEQLDRIGGINRDHATAGSDGGER